jgi:hypothetical protein
MKKLLYLLFLLGAFTQVQAQNNTVYGAGISYTNGTPSFTPPARTSRVAIDTITGKWYHFNTPGGWQLLGNTIEEIAGCSAPAYTPTKGDSKVVINNCTEPELYYWTGSVWVWINQGTTYTAGAGIRIESNSIILDSLYILRFRTGSNTDGEAGRLTWDANEGTIDVVLNAGNVTGQMFEDVFFNCRNQTGTIITRGTVVMAVGTQGASGRTLIAPAIANGTVNSEYILGTAAQNIANGADGLVYHFGKDRGLNTTGASCGETWADGDVLYCSATTPGCLTKVLPTAPNLKVPIAFVIRAGNNGTLSVRPSHFPSLAQINDVQLTSPTTGQTLIYNSVTGVWSNQTPADPSSTNELQTLSVATNTATLSNGGGSITIAGAGINTVGTAGTTITVTGTEVDGSISNELQTLSTGTNTLTLSNGGGTVTVDTDPANDVTGSGASGQVSFWTGTQTQSGDNGLWWNNTDKRLGIGLTNPLSRLHVTGVGNTVSTSNCNLRNSDNHSILTVTDNGRFLIGNTGAQAPRFFPGGLGGVEDVNQRLLFFTSGVTTEETSVFGMFTFSGGNSTITTGNQTIINIRKPFAPTSGNASFSGLVLNSPINQTGGANGTTRGLFISPTLTSAADWRSIEWNNNTGYGLYGVGTATNYLNGSTSIGAITPAARLHVVGSGSTSTTWTAQFHNSAGNNNALMIRDDGIVSIGTASPNGSGALEISSTTKGVLFPRMTTAQRNLISSPADGLVIYNTTDNKLQVRAAGVWVDLH